MRIYKVTESFPPEERYGLTAQLRRAAISIPTNIAEGCGRTGGVELARFCGIAMGSASEVEYLLYLSKELGFLSAGYESLVTATQEVSRMLAGLMRSLRTARTKT